MWFNDHLCKGVVQVGRSMYLISLLPLARSTSFEPPPRASMRHSYRPLYANKFTEPCTSVTLPRVARSNTLCLTLAALAAPPNPRR